MARPLRIEYPGAYDRVMKRGNRGGDIILTDKDRRVFQRFYPRILGWCLNHKSFFLAVPLLMLILGGLIWQG